jgi:uncharacterized membrane protein YdjX (TVP38/TMEM64 family)
MRTSLDQLLQRKPALLMMGLFGFGLTLSWRPLTLLVNHEALVMELHQAGDWSISLFVLAHIAATVIGLPGTVLVLAGGAVFGLVWGTVWSVIGATLGAIAAFYVARCLMRNWIERRFGHHRLLKKLNGMVSQNTLGCVLTIRFTPISPFNVVNFLFGLTPIDLKSYAIGTLIGIIPGTLAYTWLGVSGAKALRGEGITQLFLALGILAILSGLPLALRRKK